MRVGDTGERLMRQGAEVKSARAGKTKISMHGL